MTNSVQEIVLERIPKRFRVWDKERKALVQHPTKVDHDGDNYGPFKQDETVEYSDVFTIQDLIRMRHVCRPEVFNKLIIYQDTGIVDKNSRDIFEGDIIVDHGYTIYPDRNLVGFVTASHVAAGWTISSPMNGYRRTNLILSKVNQYEVIGNIFENPDLLVERSR